MSSHYLNPCQHIVNWTIGNNLQWNPNWNLYIFIQENIFDNHCWKMLAYYLGLNVLIQRILLIAFDAWSPLRNRSITWVQNLSNLLLVSLLVYINKNKHQNGTALGKISTCHKLYFDQNICLIGAFKMFMSVHMSSILHGKNIRTII